MPTLSKTKCAEYAPHLNAAFAATQMTTCARQSAFLAQVAHETGEFVFLTEAASGKDYEGRRDLGNTRPGDGVKYKGRGALQITGRECYQRAGKALGADFINNPQLVANPQWAFKTGAWFWNDRKLNTYADQKTQASFDKITYRINGCVTCKTTHKDRRDAYWRKARQILGC
jgi:putative chitinase